MKYLKILLIVFCLGLFFSCATFKENRTSEYLTELTETNIELLNGTYQHNEDKTPLPLDYFWGSFYKMKEYQSVYELVYEQKLPYYVNLNAINSKEIGVKIYVDGNLLKSYIIKGKIKNGYFEQSRKTFIIPAFMINSYYSSKFRNGLLENGNVVTDFKKYNFGTVYLFYPYNNSDNSINVEHTRINNFEEL